MDNRKIYKACADGDIIYIGGNNEDDAYVRICNFFGYIPRYLVKLVEVPGVPDGEELM